VSLFSSIFRARDQAMLGSWRRTVHQIERRDKQLRSTTDQELRKQSLSLQYRARSGEDLSNLLCDAFALVREAGRRTLSMQHYPVQLLGGIAMHHGSIAVMQTGEGKTLTATLPVYLAAIAGQGAHLATANDYLAERDAGLMRPVYEALGLSVGVVQASTARPARQAAYCCDVTYSTAKEIGFDFLRDRLFQRRLEGGYAGRIEMMTSDSADDGAMQPVQRGLNFVLVDEADSILIDEARTPLIVSSAPDDIALAKAALYRWSTDVADQFELDNQYKVDETSRQITLTPAGRKLARKLPTPELLHLTPMLDIYEQLEQAIFVNRNYHRDRQYVIRDGEIVIVDEFTGRLAEGRKWRAGIHQAIEAREGLKVSVETGESARITLQDLFLRYQSLAGMTGTAANSAAELRKIYQVHVVQIPTNKPPRRQRWADLVFGTETQKWEAVADEIASVHAEGRPVLVGTRSIDKSEVLAQILRQRDIPHEVLNARHLAREAAIVANAGQPGRVTVATNMAGRGTDIKLDEASLKLGGLHVICTELHESARIDRQLIGRCGRQGDPGTFRQFMSLEDEILETGLPARKHEKLKRQRHLPAQAIHRHASLFRRSQAKVEREHFQSRKMLLYREQQRQEVQREMGQDPYLDSAGA
jgi:preprotein translocase subunit SecA